MMQALHEATIQNTAKPLACKGKETYGRNKLLCTSWCCGTALHQASKRKETSSDLLLYAGQLACKARPPEPQEAAYLPSFPDFIFIERLR